MRGLEGREIIVRRKKKKKQKKQRETQVKGNNKTRNGGTRTPNEVRQQTSVTVWSLLSTRGDSSSAAEERV